MTCQTYRASLPGGGLEELARQGSGSHMGDPEGATLSVEGLLPVNNMCAVRAVVSRELEMDQTGADPFCSFGMSC